MLSDLAWAGGFVMGPRLSHFGRENILASVDSSEDGCWNALVFGFCASGAGIWKCRRMEASGSANRNLSSNANSAGVVTPDSTGLDFPVSIVRSRVLDPIAFRA